MAESPERDLFDSVQAIATEASARPGSNLQPYNPKSHATDKLMFK
jgi:hypothetical protein